MQRDRVRTVANGLGRFLITGGVLLLIFVAYQLWGTNLYEQRQQSGLRSQLDRQIEDAAQAREPVSGTTTTTVPPPPPPNGEPLAFIEIPKLGVSRVVVQGNSVPDLRKGPGHITDTALPGQVGNAGIAGHRTTYGAPFNRIDELVPGDEIIIRMTTGTFRYAVTGQQIVSPKDYYVLDPTPDAQLTLTTCHPKYSARQRLIVRSTLIPERSATPGRPASGSRRAPVGVTDLVGPPAPKAPVVWAAIITAIVGGLWWFAFHRRRRWYVWILGALPFLVAYGAFCYFLERLLPPGF